MFKEMLDVWNAAPLDLKNFVVSMAANLAVKLFPGKKEENLKSSFAEAYEEGMKYFIGSLGHKSYEHMQTLLRNDNIKTFFLNKINSGSFSTDSESIKEIIYNDKIEIDISTLEGLDFNAAVDSFLQGYNSKAEFSETLVLHSIKNKINELVELKKKEMKASEIKAPDLDVLKNKYFDFLKAQYATLSFKGLSEGKLISIPLKELYTDLAFYRKISSEKTAILKKAEDDDHSEFIQRSKQAEAITLNDIFSSPYSVITGDPGAGKSTFLKYIALNYIIKMENPNTDERESPIPIIFPIAAYAEALKKADTKYTLRTFIPEYFQGKDLPDLAPLFLQSCKNGDALFLIDGLDEVADETERKMMVDAVRNFIIADYDLKNRYIVTCRTASYTKASRFEPVKGNDFSHFVVQPFGIDQIETFLLSWYRWYEREINRRLDSYEIGAKKSLEKMIGVIRGDENILSIATNPLMLTILALIEHEGGELPRSRADLYEKCLVMFTGRWEKLRSMHEKKREDFSFGDRRITDDTVVEFLGPIAWDMLDKASTEIEYKELKHRLSEIFNKRNKDMLFSKEQADDFIAILKERSGIIQEVSTGSYGFMHQTFQEYLAARVLTDLSDDRIEQFGSKLFEAKWKEVVLLCAASLKKRDASLFIKGIMEKETEHFENLILAGECVIDTGRDKIFDDLYDNLIREMVLAATGNFQIEHRVAIAETLGYLGDTRDLEYFITIRGGNYPIKRSDFAINPFEMCKYPVTNQWYAKFIEDKGYKNKTHWSGQGKQWLDYTQATLPVYWRDRRWNCPNAPVVGVCWYEADAFARWLTLTRNDGYVYSLPDENQWEAVAAGFENREYPWGKWEEGRCNTSESNIDKTSAVGIFTKGDTPEGISDMAGNVWEWTKTDYHSKKPLTDFRFDVDLQKLRDDGKYTELHSKLDKKESQLPVIRGGSWLSDRDLARCADRSRSDPDYRFFNVGFRCVRTLK